jgi:dTDP-4-amino-4,6-dideoxygalactose transaminase
LIKLVDLERQEAQILPEIQKAILETVKRRDFILGKALQDFEDHLAAYLGVRHVVGVGSGGSALTIALKSLGIGQGDEVITQPNSHISTAFAAMNLGARPVFVDTMPDSFQMDPQQLEAAVTPRTRAILPVHIYGYAAPMQEIGEIADRHHLFVLEDAAHALGAVYRGRRCGSLGTAAAFSFYPSKNLGCWGDGGAIATMDDDVAESARTWRTYGDHQKNYHSVMGLNSRLDTVQASILDVKLKVLDDWNLQRRELAAQYCRLIQDCKLTRFVELPPLQPPNQTAIFHIFAIRVAPGKRDLLNRHMQANGIECGVHYPVPIHLQKVMSPLGHKKGAFPVVEDLADRELSLPLYAGMTHEECDQVVGQIETFFKSKASNS